MSKTDWFIHARRNASLHHLSFLMVGLGGLDWSPVVDFSVRNVIVLGIAGKGGFVYLDQGQVGEGGSTLKDIQKSVDRNPNFVADFKRRTRELFGAVFFACEGIDTENLTLLSVAELHDLYRAYIDAMLAGPLITVQVYGIEAMIDPGYGLINSRTEAYKQIFLTNDGETVPFTERKDFYRVCAAITSVDTPEAAALIDKHIAKYYWVNTEYLGGGWTREKWVSLFKEALADPVPPKQKLDELMNLAAKSAKEKADAVKELGLMPDAIHALDALGAFLAERDWTKGYVARSLLSYHTLLKEIAMRMQLSFDDVLLYSYLELDAYLVSGTTLSAEELSTRKTEGYALVIKDGSMELTAGNDTITRVRDAERIDDPLKTLRPDETVRGLVASRGKTTGIVRVIDNASKIPEFKDGEILVTYMTTIEFTPLFRKAIAVVTDEGGMSCHAAIVSREFKIPCIVGTKVATRVLQTGDMIEVDAEKGIVRMLS